jgi:hypothetical protein
LWVDRARERGRGKGVVVLAVVFNLGLLVLFKYADWLWLSLGTLLQGVGLTQRPLPLLSTLLGSAWSAALTAPDGHIRLPIGISFFTFQACSYVIDVYRRDGAVQKNPANFALYIALFPQLIAGPIVRYQDVDEQINARATTWSGFAYGVRRFVLGLGKKMLIANAAAGVADKAFDLSSAELSTPLAWVGIVAYTFQIYFDFSGYSDMAIGLGHMLGSASSRTSGIPTWRARSPSSGAAGTSRSRPGSATTSTSRSAATAARRHAPTPTWSWCSSCAGCGTGRARPSSSGASSMAASSSSSAPGSRAGSTRAPPGCATRTSCWWS